MCQTKSVLPLCSRQVLRLVQKIAMTIPVRRHMPFDRKYFGHVIGSNPVDPDR
jgi:hypothetical protein